MSFRLPDPTPDEARALILGTGGFWLCWALGAIGTITKVTLLAFAFVGAFPSVDSCPDQDFSARSEGFEPPTFYP